MAETIQKRKRLSKKGLPPGSVIYTGHHLQEEVKIKLYAYNKDQFSCTRVTAAELSQMSVPEGINWWIDLSGFNDVETLGVLTEHFNIHMLHKEDIINIHQRPKFEEEDHYIFVVMKMLNLHPRSNALDPEQISFILKDNVLITMQEKEGDTFEPVRKRLEISTSRLRSNDPSLLLYALLDVIIDDYLDALNKIGEELEVIEEIIISKPGNNTIQIIQHNKKKIIEFKKIFYPARDVLMQITKSSTPLIHENAKSFFMDVYDHTMQAYYLLESYRELNLGLKDLYLNQISHEMNKIMKVLTIISTLFIPLTFIVGVYGMNFQNMPELGWKYGYFYALGLMGIIAASLLYYFWKRKWI
jgi:magnesium transporter